MIYCIERTALGS